MKTVFITGGATGIGAASVRKFHAEGWAVVFLDVNAEAASALVDECGSDTVFVEGNTRCRDDIERAVAVGCDDFLSKPINQIELLIRVENLLKLRSVTSELERLRQYVDSMEDAFAPKKKA